MKFPGLQKDRFLKHVRNYLLFPVLISFLLLFVAPSLFAEPKDQTPPNDFEIFIHSAPRLPASSSPGSALFLETNGRCMFYETSPADGEKYVLKKEIILNPKAIEKIYTVIKKEKFFALKAEYRDPEIMDGDFAEMEVTANGKKHGVRTINIKVDAFDNIVLEINSHLPEGVDVIYNALHVDGYKRVKH